MHSVNQNNPQSIHSRNITRVKSRRKDMIIRQLNRILKRGCIENLFLLLLNLPVNSNTLNTQMDPLRPVRPPWTPQCDVC